MNWVLISIRYLQFIEICVKIECNEQIAQVIKQEEKGHMKVAKVERKLKEVKWFEVDWDTINKTLFKRVKEDFQQEIAREMICEAFKEVRSKPEKYLRKFKVMIPEKVWRKKSITKLKVLASEFGDHAADWIEQALVWAQKISNGESWEKVCNDPDTEKWYRIIGWKNSMWKLIGGSTELEDQNPSTFIYYYNYPATMKVTNAVPLIVSYE